jgi:hypothetical protein
MYAEKLDVIFMGLHYFSDCQIAALKVYKKKVTRELRL